jgi:hypothetical protein
MKRQNVGEDDYVKKTLCRKGLNIIRKMLSEHSIDIMSKLYETCIIPRARPDVARSSFAWPWITCVDPRGRIVDTKGRGCRWPHSYRQSYLYIYIYRPEGLE